MDEIRAVGEAGSVDEAWLDGDLAAAEVVLVDQDVPGRQQFIRALRERTDASVVVCSSRCDRQELIAAVEAGALGYLCKDTLTPESLLASVRTAATGAGVLAPDLLGDLLRTLARTSRDV